MLLPSIKMDLSLSDTQVGFVSGMAFALFYGVMGIPIARIADNYNRSHLLSVALGLWSIMTAISGLVVNFIQLVLARIFVGVGEAGCSPTSQSLLSDYFPPERRATAMSIYVSSAAAGVLVGFPLGGWLTETFSWRIALMVVSAPGLVLALFLPSLLADPRSRAISSSVTKNEAPSSTTALRYLWHLHTFRMLVCGMGFYGIVYVGVLTWLPSFFERNYGLSLSQIGLSLSLTVGLSALLGALIGGPLTDHLARHDVRWYVWLPGITQGLCGPLYTIGLLAPSYNIAFVALFFPFMLGATLGGPAYALAQTLASPRIRATAAAVLLAVFNVFGSGGGPLIVGIISDKLLAISSANSLQMALVITALMGSVGSALFFGFASRSIEHEVGCRPESRV